MLGTSSAFAINVTLNKNLPYDPAKDFAPIVLTSNAPFLMLVNPDLPVKSVPDLIKLAKEKPGQLSYGSAGPGSPQHLSMELFKMLTGTNLVHVPYRGDAPALNDLLARAHPDAVRRADAGAAAAEGRQGAGARRSRRRRGWDPRRIFRRSRKPASPASISCPGSSSSRRPARRRTIVDKLHAAFKAVLKLPEIQKEFATTGRIPVDSASPADLQKFVQSEIVRLGKVVEQAGIARSQ